MKKDEDEEKMSDYEETKAPRKEKMLHKVKEFMAITGQAHKHKALVECRKINTKKKKLDQIQFKECVQTREQLFKKMIGRAIIDFGHHAASYEDCLRECQINRISYLIANRSCEQTFQENFTGTAEKFISSTNLDKRIDD